MKVHTPDHDLAADELHSYLAELDASSAPVETIKRTPEAEKRHQETLEWGE